MSETTEVTADVTSGGATAEAAVAERAGTTRRRRAGGGLASMLLPELQSLAASLGISGTARMRKGELVTAIQERQAATAARSEVAAAPRTESPKDERPKVAAEPLPIAVESASQPVAQAASAAAPATGAATADQPSEGRTRRASRPAGPPEPRPSSDVRAAQQGEPAAEERSRERSDRQNRDDRAQNERGQSERGDRRDRNDRDGQRGDRDNQRGERG
ncbi:Rho termination factor N-terminal domain-containing protein, partial [Virgisporangium ochraceum]|uniref:Rho termination factor N-terminal domain-containing protein n=1 Tax=Virgisporangium ochraceum TaxID=65505 RepID=UPI001944F23C